MIILVLQQQLHLIPQTHQVIIAQFFGKCFFFHDLDKNKQLEKTTTTTTTMSYKQKDLADVDFSDIDELLSKLTPEEIEILNGEVDPDVSNKRKNLSFPFPSIPTTCFNLPFY
jgi:hypothetical protein